MVRQFGRSILASLVGLLTLSGCAPSATSPGGSESTWTEPGWMAQARQADEEYQTRMMSCLSESGVVGIPGLGGAIVLEGNVPENLVDLQSEVFDSCAAEIPAPERWNAALDDNAYQRMLDVRTCIIDQGYELPEAPSAEVWMQSESWEAWNPYQVLTDPQLSPTGTILDRATLAELMEVCPQSGAGMVFVFD